MKKTLFYSVVTLLSLLLFSCGDGQNPPAGNEGQGNSDADTVPTLNGVECQYVGGSYFGDEYGVGAENFWFGFTTGSVSVDEQGNVTGDGEIIYVDMLSAKSENLFPINAKYPINSTKKESTVVAGYLYDIGLEMGMEPGIEVWSMGTYVSHIKGGEITDEQLIIGGSFLIKGDQTSAVFQLTAEFADGTSAAYQYSGEAKITDATVEGGEGGEGGEGENPEETFSFEWEPVSQSNFDLKFDECVITNYGDYFALGNDYVTVDLDSKEWFATLDLFAPAGTTSPVGRYTVSDDGEDWTCLVSPGGDIEGDNPSFFGTDFEGDYYHTSYYVKSGFVEITETGLTLDVMTHFGSHVKASYVGTTDFNKQEKISIRRIVDKESRISSTRLSLQKRIMPR